MSPEAEAFTSNKRDASVPAIGHVTITSNHSYSSITVLTPRTDHPQIDTGSPHGIYDNRLPPRKHTVPSFYCSHTPTHGQSPPASYSISKSLVYTFPIGTFTSTEPPNPLFYQARFTVIYEFPGEKESGEVQSQVGHLREDLPRIMVKLELGFILFPAFVGGGG